LRCGHVIDELILPIGTWQRYRRIYLTDIDVATLSAYSFDKFGRCNAIDVLI